MEGRGAAVTFPLNKFYKCATFAPLDNPQFIYHLFHDSSLDYAV